MRLTEVNLQMERKIAFDYPAYAVNRTVFFTYGLFWFIGVRRKFSRGGVSFSGMWWSFVLGVGCLWRHNL